MTRSGHLGSCQAVRTRLRHQPSMALARLVILMVTVHRWAGSPSVRQISTTDFKLNSTDQLSVDRPPRCVLNRQTSSRPSVLKIDQPR